MLVALRPAATQADFLAPRRATGSSEGALPASGSDGAAIHRDVARARGMRGRLDASVASSTRRT